MLALEVVGAEAASCHLLSSYYNQELVPAVLNNPRYKQQTTAAAAQNRQQQAGEVPKGCLGSCL